MRTRILIIVFAASMLVAFSQPLKKTSIIKEEEVPVAIRQAFINDFGSIPPNGKWTVNFNVTHEGARTMAQPTAYSYHNKEGHSKIEVRYNTDGKLDYAKGLSTRPHDPQTGNQ